MLSIFEYKLESSAVVKRDSEQNMTSPKVMKETLQKEEREKNRVVALVAYEARKVPRFFNIRMVKSVLEN